MKIVSDNDLINIWKKESNFLAEEENMNSKQIEDIFRNQFISIGGKIKKKYLYDILFTIILCLIFLLLLFRINNIEIFIIGAFVVIPIIIFHAIISRRMLIKFSPELPLKASIEMQIKRFTSAMNLYRNTITWGTMVCFFMAYSVLVLMEGVQLIMGGKDILLIIIGILIPFILRKPTNKFLDFYYGAEIERLKEMYSQLD
jgi:hypothetical protein